MKKLLVKYWWNWNQVSIFIQGGYCLDHVVPEVRHHRPLLRYPVHFLFAEGNAEQRSPNHRSHSGENYLTKFSKKSVGLTTSFYSSISQVSDIMTDPFLVRLHSFYTKCMPPEKPIELVFGQNVMGPHRSHFLLQWNVAGHHWKGLFLFKLSRNKFGLRKRKACLHINWCLSHLVNCHDPDWRKPNLSTKYIECYYCPSTKYYAPIHTWAFAQHDDKC